MYVLYVSKDGSISSQEHTILLNLAIIMDPLFREFLDQKLTPGVIIPL